MTASVAAAFLGKMKKENTLFTVYHRFLHRKFDIPLHTVHTKVYEQGLTVCCTNVNEFVNQ